MAVLLYRELIDFQQVGATASPTSSLGTHGAYLLQILLKKPIMQYYKFLVFCSAEIMRTFRFFSFIHIYIFLGYTNIAEFFEPLFQDS
jgi:hypothetical protein